MPGIPGQAKHTYAFEIKCIYQWAQGTIRAVKDGNNARHEILGHDSMQSWPMKYWRMQLNTQARQHDIYVLIGTPFVVFCVTYVICEELKLDA